MGTPKRGSGVAVPRQGGRGGGPGGAGREFHRLFGILAVAVLLTGIAASVIGCLAWRSYLQANATRTFDSTAETAAGALSVRLQRDVDLAATAGTLVTTTPSLTNARFATWFRVLGARASYPGSLGLLYIENVRQQQLNGFARQVKQDPPFGLPMHRPFSILPATSSSPYCLTRAGAVQARSGTALSLASLAGLLSFTQPDLDYCALALGSLLRRSARTGEEAALTLSSVLKRAPHEPGVPKLPAVLPKLLKKKGLIVTMTPIYEGGGAIPSVQSARLSDLKGWILGIYEADSILTPVLRGHPGEAAILSYANPSRSTTVLAVSGRSTPGELTRTFRLAATGGWSITFSAPPPLLGLPANDQGLAVLSGGLLLSVLLFALIRVLSRSRTRALQLVVERTSQLRHQALHDSLTELPNRELILDRTEQMLARARRNGTGVAVLFLDLDGFKDVNDTFGHDCGDELLRDVGARLSASLRDADTVGRLGGDEFVVVVEDAGREEGPEEVADRLIAALRPPFRIGENGVRLATISASIGIASGLRDSAGELLRDADVALYEAKAATNRGYVVFHPDMRTAIAARLALEADLRAAIRQGELFLAYQPIFSLDSQQMTGAEALLRWRHPERGIVMPDEFMATLEATGMILQVGRFVLEEACRQAAEWASRGHVLTVSVNVAGRQLEREDFIGVVEHALAASGLDSSNLTIEITETTLMRDVELSSSQLTALKALGVNIAVDDFGTGYCSLAYLQQFPVDTLKIDRSFVSRMESSEDGTSLVRAIIRMAQDLDLGTLAEGIETPEQLERLRLDECNSGQGFLFAHPLEASAFSDLVATSPTWHPSLEGTAAVLP
ncbi:MAG: putative bifunctional diguanylate cyclase/phosphodiesterase [Acidimicrobiales bacterium]